MQQAAAIKVAAWDGYVNTGEAPPPGHDGNTPEFMPPRDIEGKGKRKIEGILNVNTDRLGYLEAHGRISATHLAAGRKLQIAYEISQGLNFALSKDEGLIGSGSVDAQGDGVTVQACLAGRRVKAAMAYLGEDGEQIVRLVAIGGSDGQGLSLARAECIMRLPVGGGIGALRVALGTLARHYGLT